MRLPIGQLVSAARGSLYDLTHSSTANLAVTGLSRAGKTVFMTSLIQNLLCTSSVSGNPKGALEAFEPFKRGILRTVMLSPSGAQSRPRFPFEECLAALAAESPGWPKRTGAVSEIDLTLRFGRTKQIDGKRGKDAATMTLHLVDYPGEWLLDLPLLGQTFEQWSTAMIALSRERTRTRLSEKWRALLEGQDFSRPSEDAFARQAAEAYRDYLLECRRHGLKFLQPGQFLRLPGQDEEDVRPILDRPQLWFCPIPPPPDGKWKAGSLGAAMAGRYQAYCSETVKGFLNNTFGRYSRQLVLVDVLGALGGGGEIFDDTCRALAEVFRCFSANSDSLWRRIRDLGSPRIDKIAFASTKADHVPRLQRENLARLLDRMLRREGTEARSKGTDILTTYLSSVCSTEEDRVQIDGRMHDAVVGCRVDTGKRSKVVINAIPGDMPDRAYWARYGDTAFDFPIFQPPRFNAHGSGGIAHIGMERLLNFLIGDRFG